MDSTESSAKSKAGKLAYESNLDEELECAVCLQPCIHPVRLPCSHIFCFLCVKGVANQSKRCAMCRQEIPADFLDNPLLVKKMEEKETETEGYQWFYEGRNGWWQYDERTSVDLEIAYSRGLRVFEVLVAGFLYSVDFDRMIQQRRSDPSRRRRIKRDLSTIPKKGVAGLKMEGFNADESDETHIFPPSLPSPVYGTDESGTSSAVGDANLGIPETTPESRWEPSSLQGSDRQLSSELESLYLLHSELPQNVYRNHHRRSPLSLQSASTTAGVIPRSSSDQTSDPRVRKPPAEATRPRSAPIESTHDLDRDSFPPESIPTAERCWDDTESVDTLTGRIRTLILDTEGTEFYSLDGAEEYMLSNDES